MKITLDHLAEGYRLELYPEANVLVLAVGGPDALRQTAYVKLSPHGAIALAATLEAAARHMAR